MYTIISLALFCTLATALPTTNSSSSRIDNGLSKRQNICGGTTFSAGHVIEAVDFNTGESYGYLAPGLAGIFGGGYGLVTPNENEALQDFVACSDPSAGPATITASNVEQTEPGPFIGLISVFADGPPQSPDLGPGSPYWLRLAPTTKIANGALPDHNYTVDSTQVWFESGVWSYDCDPSTLDCDISARWVNSDGSTPATFIAAAPEQGGIVVTGDYNAFIAIWGGTGDWSQVRLVAKSV